MTPKAIRTICKALAIVSVVAGAYGSLLCMPFAFSRYLPVIATAGIYFAAGAVLIVGGLIGYVLLIKQETVSAITTAEE